ncbi:hypothetical protein ACN6K9_006053 [Streptomyces sp. SAS_267]|uniref:hypothetical protein n=1 Tax=Streptomyces sp. SAS_267 TaxID=3412750 RepID=UPI00403CA41B
MADLSMLAQPFPEQGLDPGIPDALPAERPEEEDFDEIEEFDDALPVALAVGGMRMLVNS